MTGTVANPSNPSVKLTAFDAPIITNKANGIKIKPCAKLNLKENTNHTNIRDQNILLI